MACFVSVWHLKTCHAFGDIGGGYLKNDLLVFVKFSPQRKNKWILNLQSPRVQRKNIKKFKFEIWAKKPKPSRKSQGAFRCRRQTGVLMGREPRQYPQHLPLSLSFVPPSHCYLSASSIQALLARRGCRGLPDRRHLEIWILMEAWRPNKSW